MSSSAQAPAALPADGRLASSLRRAARSPGLRLIAKRFATAIPVLWGVTFITFVVMNLLPGTAAQQLLGAQASPAQVEQLSEELGLDRPFLERYGDWLGGVVHGDLGASLSSGQPVTTILGDRLPATFQLLLYAFVVSLALTVPVAVLAARRPNGIVDRLSMVVSMAGLSVANYVLALFLVYVFAVKLRVLPAIGYVPFSESPGENIRTLTLPAISIGFPLFCFYTRLLRADILEQMYGEDYVMTAKAKGAGPWRVLVRHALRNSLLGLITIIGLNLGTLIGATVIIEEIFSLPGIGQQLLQAINNRDIPIVEGIVLVLAAAVVLVNLVTDMLYALLDPRIRHGRSEV